MIELSEEELRAHVERINDAWIDNDQDVLLDYVADDIRWNMVGYDVTEGKEAFEESLNSMPTMTTEDFQREKVVVEGSTAMLTGTMKTRDEEGRAQSMSFCDSYEFRGEMISEITSYVIVHDHQSKE